MPPPAGSPPIGAPGGAGPAKAGPEKKKPSILFLILDFLVFGGSVAGMVLLLISN
jgi:hypothetical protein